MSKKTPDWKLDMLRKLWDGEDTDPDKLKAEVPKGKKKTPKVKGKPWPSVDLHRYDELLTQLAEAEKAIDKAIKGGHTGLIIIHGKGRGVLRAELRKALERHPAIDEISDVKDVDGKSGSLKIRFT